MKIFSDGSAYDREWERELTRMMKVPVIISFHRQSFQTGQWATPTKLTSRNATTAGMDSLFPTFGFM
jgi:hypothetical protein